MKNKIDDLRNHLFETIEMLKDEDKPMEIDRAKAVSDVAGTIIESAKVEVKFAEISGQLASSSKFFSQAKELPPARTLKELN